MCRITCTCLLLLIVSDLCAQAYLRQQEIGIPPHQDFTPADYKANGQNFSIVTDNRGVMYFANFAGILEYDGSRWRTIYTSNISKVNSLTKDSEGRIYVGARGEIGYLDPNQRGEMQFVSLTRHLSPTVHDFPEVIKCFATPGGIYYITPDYIHLWNGKKLISEKASSPVLNAFYVQENLYLLLKDTGLYRYQANKFVKVPGGDQFSGLVVVNALLPLGKDSLLLGSGNQGLFTLTKKGVARFDTPANDFLIQNRISCGALLQNGTYAFGTAEGGVEGGVVLLDKKGKVLQIFNKQLSGLFDNKTNYLYQDATGGLWIAMNRGLTRIELNSSLMYFDTKKNISGNVNGIQRYKGSLYVTTNEGLFRYDNTTSTFRLVSAINAACWSLAISGKDLLVATTNGVYAYDGGHARMLSSGYALTIYPSKSDPAAIYIGFVNGLGLLRKQNGLYLDKGKQGSIRDEISAIVEDEDRNIWLQIPAKGLVRLPARAPEKSSLYTASKGLPNNVGLQLNETSRGILVGTAEGAYAYNKDTDRFSKRNIADIDPSLNTNWLSKITEDYKGNIWVNAGDEASLTLFRNTDKGFIKDNALQPIHNLQIFTIHPEPDGKVWLGSSNNLILFTITKEYQQNRAYHTLIRSVVANKDTLFGGTFVGENGIQVPGQTGKIPSLESRQNNLTFEFATPLSTSEQGLQYYYYLQGFDADTVSNWTLAREKEYSNLPPGDYVFRVKSRNAYGAESQAAAYAFTISTPFYRSIWAYILYGILILGLIIAVVRLRSRQLLNEKKRLENLIKERTEEVVAQKEEIENQSLELANKNDELEKINLIVKSINSEVNFSNLLQSILDRTRIIRGAEKAAMLVHDKATEVFKFKASYGYNNLSLEDIELTLEEAEIRYLSVAEELYEDIFFVKSVKSTGKDAMFAEVNKARSVLIMILKIHQRTEAFLILENWQKHNAFIERDFSLLQNLKEHFIAAFIKTTLLEDLQNTLVNLKETQEQLIRQEKLASIGQLTKGIVDRILNPLNYITNFSLISNGLIQESKELLGELEQYPDDKEEILDNLEMVRMNLQKVNEHGVSATRIVKGMEKLLREKSTQLALTDLNLLVEANLQSALEEAKKEYPDIPIRISKQLDDRQEKVLLLPSEMNTLLQNLLSNAFYYTIEKHKEQQGEEAEVKVSTSFLENSVEVRIRDNGKGIPATQMQELFSPFYTTKPTAKGTGLGLYISQDIVNEHKGSISVDSISGEYTEFIIQLPKKVQRAESSLIM